MTATFWLLESSGEPTAEQADDTEYEGVTCPTNSGHRRAGRRIGRLSVTVTPSGVKDFTWVWGGGVLVSQRVLDLFDKYHVTGFEAVPAKIAYRKGNGAPPPDLYELVVKFGGLPAKAAGASLARGCPDCGFKQYAIAEPSRLIDVAAWDGSDLFFVWPFPNYQFVSDRLASILRQEKVTGAELIPAAEIPMEKGATGCPGPFSYYMPEDRAREMERRFGW